MRVTLPLLAVFASALCACADSAPTAATAPSLELVDATLQLDASLVNSHTYGSFAIPVAGGVVAIRSGPANHPGNSKHGPGTCVDGMWINQNGKPTAGSLEKPHPHCTTIGTAMMIVLEPISSRTRDPNDVKCISPCDVLYMSDPKFRLISVYFQPAGAAKDAPEERSRSSSISTMHRTRICSAGAPWTISRRSGACRGL